MPGYPAFLAVIYAVTGNSAQAVRVVQAVLGALLCIPVFAIARRLIGVVGAVLAGLGIAFHPLLIYMSGWLYSETLFLLILWTGIWLLIRGLDSNKSGQTVVAGVALGFATLVRPEIAFFPLFALAFGWMLRWPPHVLRAMFVAQIVLIGVILPWTTRNTLAHHRFVLLTTNSGSNLYGGNNALADGGFRADVAYVLPGFSEVDSNQVLTYRAWEWIKDHPKQFLQLLPRKLYKFMSPLETGTSENPLRKWAWPINLVYGSFLVLVLWGIKLVWNQWGGDVMVALIIYYTLLSLVFFGSTRFALPVMPAQVVLASVVATSLASKRWRKHEKL